MPPADDSDEDYLFVSSFRGTSIDADAVFIVLRPDSRYQGKERIPDVVVRDFGLHMREGCVSRPRTSKGLLTLTEISCRAVLMKQ